MQYVIDRVEEKNKQNTVIRIIEDSIFLKKYLQMEADVLIAIADCLIQAFQNGNKVLLIGNGGSAADAQHIAAEFSGKLYRDRDSLPAIALTTNSSALTAIANDYSYDDVFTRQLKGLVKEGDVVIGISTSGDSLNVINAMHEAKCRGAYTVAFTGNGGGLSKSADYVLAVPSNDTPRIQEVHITAGHIICYLVEDHLFGDNFS